jgi:hypothetical protein
VREKEKKSEERKTKCKTEERVEKRGVLVRFSTFFPLRLGRIEVEAEVRRIDLPGDGPRGGREAPDPLHLSKPSSFSLQKAPDTSRKLPSAPTERKERPRSSERKKESLSGRRSNTDF